MPQIQDVLQALRDAAYLDESAVLAIADTAQVNFDAIRLLDDSPTKVALLRDLGSVVVAGRNLQRELDRLWRDNDQALATYTDVVPPLPNLGTDHIQFIIESSPGLLPANQPFGSYYATEPLDLLPERSGLIVKPDGAAATNEAVIRVMLGATTVMTATLAPAATEATMAVYQAEIPANSLLTFMSPAAQDPTLAGIVGTFVARRV